MTLLDLYLEPTGPYYRRFIEVASEWSDRASLVARSHWAPRIQPFVTRLGSGVQAYGVSEVHSWPGTTIAEPHPALLYSFEASTFAAQFLIEEVDGLFDWNISLHRPEDLAFYDDKGVAWMGSISHEAAAWVDLSPERAAEFESQVGIPLLRTPERPPGRLDFSLRADFALPSFLAATLARSVLRAEGIACELGSYSGRFDRTELEVYPRADADLQRASAVVVQFGGSQI